MCVQISCHSPQPGRKPLYPFSSISLDSPHPMVALGPESWLLTNEGWFEHLSKQMEIKSPTRKGEVKRFHSFSSLIAKKNLLSSHLRAFFSPLYDQWRLANHAKQTTIPFKYYYNEKLPPLKAPIYPLQWHLWPINLHTSSLYNYFQLPVLSRWGSDSL